MKKLKWILMAAILTFLNGFSFAQVGEQNSKAAEMIYAHKGAFIGLVDIGEGRKLYLECQGNGFPTVVLVS